jgi:hypothetical protein
VVDILLMAYGSAAVRAARAWVDAAAGGALGIIYSRAGEARQADEERGPTKGRVGSGSICWCKCCQNKQCDTQTMKEMTTCAKWSMRRRRRGENKDPQRRR